MICFICLFLLDTSQSSTCVTLTYWPIFCCGSGHVVYWLRSKRCQLFS